MLFTLCIIYILIHLFFYKTNESFKYYTKFFIYFTTMSLTAVVLIPIFALRPRNPHNFVISSILLRRFSTLLGIKYVLEGQQYLEKNKPSIIVANHQSILDILGMFECFIAIQHCLVIGTRGLLWTGPFGLACWLAGETFIERKYTIQTQVALDRVLNTALEKKYSLWLFPEGGVKTGGKIRPFRKGAFHLAIKAKIPIVPVVFSKLYFFDREKKKFDNGRVVIRALPPICTKAFDTANIDVLIDSTRNSMIETYNQLNEST